MPGDQKYKFFQVFVIGVIGLVSVLALFTLSSALMKKGPMAPAASALQGHAKPTAPEPGYEDWLNDAEGYSQILGSESAETQPLIVYFYAPWCPYCKRFSEHILTRPDVKTYLKPFNKVRIYPDRGMQAEQALMQQFGAQGFPTFLVKFPGQAGFTQVHPYRENGDYRTTDEFITAVEAVKTAHP